MICDWIDKGKSHNEVVWMRLFLVMKSSIGDFVFDFFYFSRNSFWIWEININRPFIYNLINLSFIFNPTIENKNMFPMLF